MDLSQFLVVGENIHCTRIVKRGGKSMATLGDGREVIVFKQRGEERQLPVPTDWETVSPDFAKGKVKHVALAIYQALEGATEEERQLGEAYLCYVAQRQVDKGATYLDVNVDEYHSDIARTIPVMDWLTKFLGERFEVPLSIDSSNPETIAVGLRNCRSDLRPPMVNSFSLERPEIIDVVAEFGAEAIVGASGHGGLPSAPEERMANFRAIIEQATGKGVPLEKMHLDPLALPVSTNPENGANFLEATRQAHAEWPTAHLNGGLSNISFGMPNRKLLNMVFIWLCAEAGTDGGIIDPVTIPTSAVEALAPDSEKFQLAKGVLTGEDEFGMDYIEAYREGRLKG